MATADERDALAEQLEAAKQAGTDSATEVQGLLLIYVLWPTIHFVLLWATNTYCEGCFFLLTSCGCA